MDKYIKASISLLFILVSALPAKAYNSDDVFLFNVPKGATVYGIARDLSIPVDTLIKYNPRLRDGLTAGIQIFLPASTVSEENLKKVDAAPTFVGGALHDLCRNDTLSSPDGSRVAINEEVLSESQENKDSANGRLRAVVCRDDKCGFVNEYGREVIPLIYKDATAFYNGFAYVRKGNSHYLIDGDGKIVTDLTSYIPNNEYMRYSYCSYNPLDGSVCIDLCEKTFENDPQNSYITWDTNGKVQIVNLKLPKGALWSPYSRILNSDVRYFYNGKVSKRNLSPISTANDQVTVYSIGVYDKNYNLIFSSTAKDLHPFSNGLARITDFRKINAGNQSTSKNYKVQYGFIDLAGRRLPNCNYDYAMDFSDGLACVTMNGKSGYIDKTGKIVIPLIFDGEMPQTVDNAEREMWETCNWHIDAIYDIRQFNNGLAIQRYNGENVIIDKRGNIINPLTEFKGYIMPVEYFNNGIIVFFSRPSIDDGKVADFGDLGYSAYKIDGGYIVPFNKYSYIGPFIEIKDN